MAGHQVPDIGTKCAEVAADKAGTGLDARQFVRKGTTPAFRIVIDLRTYLHGIQSFKFLRAIIFPDYLQAWLLPNSQILLP